MRAKTLNQCSEAGFFDFVLANPVLDRHPDLTWILRRVYWRNAGLGHRSAIDAAVECAKGYARTDPELAGLVAGSGVRDGQA